MQNPGLGDKLRQLREAAGITLRELSRQAGLSPSFICDLEAGRRFPSSNNLVKITKTLGVAASELADLDHRQTLANMKHLLENDPAWAPVVAQILKAASDGIVKPEQMLKRLQGGK